MTNIKLAEFLEDLSISFDPIDPVDETSIKLRECASALRTAGSEREKAIREAASAARNVQLLNHYRWGNDPIEQFNFGKKCAELAIRALLQEKPK